MAGGLAGLVCGSFAAGVLLGLAALFPLRLVAWAAEGGAARRGSVLDAVDVRQAWGVAAVLITIVPAPLLSLAPDLPGLTVVYAVGLAALLWVAFADLRDFRRLARLAAEASAGVIAPLSAVQREVPVADVGVGNQQHERRQPGAPYRGGDELLSVVRGDAGEARRRLAGRLFLDLGLITVTALLFAIAAGVRCTLPESLDDFRGCGHALPAKSDENAASRVAGERRVAYNVGEDGPSSTAACGQKDRSHS